VGLCYSPAVPATFTERKTEAPRHSAVVRVTHWLTLIAFVALLISGLGITVSHPRFYLGEVGNVNMKPLFTLPIPASRDMVHTRYHFMWPDFNGWGRYLHFEAAWLLVFTALVYGVWGVWTGHFRRNLLPEPGERMWRGYSRAFGLVVKRYLGRAPEDKGEARRYNVAQRTAYLLVIFVVFPLMIWTGLAMSPAFSGVFPESVILLGGRQTARTLHFLLTWVLVLFVLVHVTMVALAGFWRRVRAMITGRSAVSGSGPEEGA
jgi:thiosulfate reductase cytochrome b subunit